MTPPGPLPPKPELDPTTHLLTGPVLEGPDDGPYWRPVPLDELAAKGRKLLASGADFDSRPYRASREIIAISPGRASIIADLLEELSVRLRPGTEVGPIRSDGSLSALALELSDDMMRRAHG